MQIVIELDVLQTITLSVPAVLTVSTWNKTCAFVVTIPIVNVYLQLVVTNAFQGTMVLVTFVMITVQLSV